MDFISKPMGWLMEQFYNLTGHYALALILYALAMQLILIPFAIKQQKNMRRQSELRPQEMIIRKKYKGKTSREAQQKMSMEIQEMYQREGYNVMSGCLPMLFQLLLIVPLYSVIRNPVTYVAGLTQESIARLYALVAYVRDGAKNVLDVTVQNINGLFQDGKLVADFAEKAKSVVSAGEIPLVKELNSYADAGVDISQFLVNGDTYDKSMLNFDLFNNVSLLDNPSFTSWLIIIPILIFATSVLSHIIMQKYTMPQQSEDTPNVGNSALMKWGMPLFSTVISFSFSSAIGLYWVYGNIIRLGQSLLIAKFIPLKTWTPEELASVEKEYKKKRKKKKVIMIEVDEDDNSYAELEITKEEAERRAARKARKEAEKLSKEDGEVKAGESESAENEVGDSSGGIQKLEIKDEENTDSAPKNKKNKNK